MAANIEVDGLTPTQERAILALLTYPTIKAEIVERTLHTWIDEPAFNKALRKARRQAFQQAIAMCQRATPVAVQTLYKIVNDANTKPNVKVAAASAIMRFGRESIELDDLAGRIEALEASASQEKQQDSWKR
jgi:hypothetical protein